MTGPTHESSRIDPRLRRNEGIPDPDNVLFCYRTHSERIPTDIVFGVVVTELVIVNNVLYFYRLRH